MKEKNEYKYESKTCPLIALCEINTDNKIGGLEASTRKSLSHLWTWKIGHHQKWTTVQYQLVKQLLNFVTGKNNETSIM